MTKGIKETLELIFAVDVLAKCLAEAKKDGVINIWDVPKFAGLILPMKRAIEGAEHIADELKDLSAEEVQIITEKLFAAVMALSAAVISKPVK